MIKIHVAREGRCVHISSGNNCVSMTYEELKSLSQIEFIPTDLKSTSPWFTDIYIEERERLLEFLKQNSIGSRIVYPPIHSQKAYNLKKNFPVTEKYATSGLWLPSSMKLTDADIREICAAIRKFYGR